MKRIIEGKVYDTDTATCIAAENKSLRKSLISSETLYRTQSGKWFLHGKSSAMGKYGDGWNPGETLIAMTETEVAEWSNYADITDDERDTIIKLLNLPEA